MVDDMHKICLAISYFELLSANNTTLTDLQTCEEEMQSDLLGSL